jgi:crotonobetainyl-CoA:carnitine CoA-transferase CaiB-like acyl-CoA transferase
MTASAVVEWALAALLHRERTGEGRHVPAAAPERRRAAEPHGHTYIRAPYGVFATKDGHMALALPPLDALGDALGLPELGGPGAAPGGHSCRDEITALVRLRLPRRTTAEWVEAFEARGIRAGPVTPRASAEVAS